MSTWLSLHISCMIPKRICVSFNLLRNGSPLFRRLLVYVQFMFIGFSPSPFVHLYPSILLNVKTSSECASAGTGRTTLAMGGGSGARDAAGKIGVYFQHSDVEVPGGIVGSPFLMNDGVQITRFSYAFKLVMAQKENKRLFQVSLFLSGDIFEAANLFFKYSCVRKSSIYMPEFRRPTVVYTSPDTSAEVGMVLYNHGHQGK